MPSTAAIDLFEDQREDLYGWLPYKTYWKGCMYASPQPVLEAFEIYCWNNRRKLFERQILFAHMVKRISYRMVTAAKGSTRLV